MKLSDWALVIFLGVLALQVVLAWIAGIKRHLGIRREAQAAMRAFPQQVAQAFQKHEDRIAALESRRAVTPHGAPPPTGPLA